MSTLAPGHLIPALIFGAFVTGSAQTRPNIVFIFTDDHATQAIPAYGGFLKDVARTPNIDRLAREGMRFDKAYVTNALCGPSRAVIQTGKYSHKNGFMTNEAAFDASQPTMPKLLRAAGYQTAVVGKWHLVSDPLGFDFWDVLPGQGAYYNPQFIRGDAAGRKQVRAIQGSNSRIVGDIALDWLRNGRDKSKPFLLMYQFKAPHRQWQPGPEYVGRYQGVKIPEPRNLLDDFRWRGSAARFQDMTIRHTMTRMDLKLDDPNGFAFWLPEQKTAWNAYYGKVKADFASRGFSFEDRTDNALVRWKYQRYMEDYLSVSEEMDAEVGRMLGFLDSSGLTSNTLVVYSSDQGFFLGEHGWFDKRFMYEESLRTPLVARWPGVAPAGSVNGDLVSNLDFPETFLELAGAPIPADMQGASLVPLLKGQRPASWRKSHYYHYYEGPPAEHHVYRHYGVTTGRHKLVYFHDVDEWEFYDLAKDPGEMINQYWIPENAATIKELKAELARLRQQFEVPADPPRDTSLRTISLEKWTTPLADPVVVRERVGGFDMTWIRKGNRVRFEAGEPKGGSLQVSIHRVDGSLLESLPGDGSFEWDLAGWRAGIYVVEFRRKKDVRFLKIRI